MRSTGLLVALTACVTLGLAACATDQQANPGDPPSSAAANEPQATTTTEVPEDPSCRQAVEFTVATVAATARETTVGIEAFTTEEDLGEYVLGFLFSLPEDIGVDSGTACGNATKSIPELKRALESTVDNEPQPVADLTLGFFALGCSENAPLGPDDDPAEVEIYLENICPFIDGYFEERGFNLEGGSSEPGFR